MPYFIKKLLFYSIIFTGLKINSQDVRFVIFHQYDVLQVYDKIGFNTFNFGGGVEYQMSTLYFKAQFLKDFKREGIDYFDVEGIVGLNFHSRFKDWRYYIGAKLGAINRLGWGHAKTGLESGIDHYFHNLFFGTYIKWDHNTDGRVFRFQDANYSRISLGIRTGIIL
jgi:hypothetical protein